MSNAFTLFAEIKADTGAVERALASTEKKAESLTQELTKTESVAKSVGNTSATTANKFEQLKSTLSTSNQKVREAAEAFKAGHISAKQMASVVNQTERSFATLSSKIQTANAGLADYKSKADAAAKTRSLRPDRAMDVALRDIARMKAQTAKGEADLTRLTARHQEQRARSAIAATEKQIAQQLAAVKATSGVKGGLASQLGNNQFLAGISGGLAGAGIAGAGLAAFGMTKQLVGGIASLGASSVEMAADFQMTQNAMAVFTGSTEKAKTELAALAELSRKTPGLGLEDAEKGATRLRAMGFSAETATSLLTGLAKQKILSGVGSEAIERTTLNLAQLASGGGDFQDIKDLVQNLPTARKEINEAFGSLQGFQAALKANPQEAIKRFADELAGVQAPAGGFNDALQKLNDSFLVTGRAFGEPILDPLTDGVHTLTSALLSGESGWRAWGQTAGDQIRAVADIARGAGMIDSATGGWLSSVIGAGLQQIARQQLPVATHILDSLENVGALGRTAKAVLAGELKLDPNSPNVDLEAQKKNALEQIKIQAEARQHNINEVSKYQAYIQSLNQSAFKVQEAQLANHLSKTEASELQSIRAQANLKEQQIKAAMRTDKAAFDGMLSMAAPGERGAIQMKANEAMVAAQAELAANALNAQVRLREAIKKLKTDIASMFTGAFQNNPFVQIFEQGRLAIERVKEATQGLSPQLRAMLMTLTAGATATAAFGQALDNKLAASNLRASAAQFKQGFLSDDEKALERQARRRLAPNWTSKEAFDATLKKEMEFLAGQNFRENLNRQLRDIGAFGSRSGLTDGEIRKLDQAVIGILGNTDPSKLDSRQRAFAASSSLNEAAALDAEQKQAKEIQKKLLTVLQNLEGNKALEIAIADPNGRTAIASTSSNVNARYK